MPKQDEFVFRLKDEMNPSQIADQVSEASRLLQRLLAIALSNGVDLGSQFCQVYVQGASAIAGAAALAKGGSPIARPGSMMQ